MRIDLDAHCRTVRFGGNRYDLRFSDGALRNVYLRPDFAGAVAAVPDHHQNFDQLRETRPEEAVLVDSDRTCVFWRSAIFKEITEGLVITLAPEHLAARLEFLFNPTTGSLQPKTTLIASSQTAVDVRAALRISVLLSEPVHA